jgi:hypothetical protein
MSADLKSSFVFIRFFRRAGAINVSLRRPRGMRRRAVRSFARIVALLDRNIGFQGPNYKELMVQFAP